MKVAIVAGLIGQKCLQRLNERNGRFWYYNSVRNLGRVLSYLSVDEIRLALKKAEQAGLIIRDNFNKMLADKTGWYSAEPALVAALSGTRIAFRESDANEFGLDAAVVLHHVRHTGNDVVQPARLSKYLPISTKRIVKALTTLQVKGVL